MASEPLISAPLVELRDRTIYRIGDSEPAVWLIDDLELGGILVNAPIYSESLLEAIRAISKPAYLFLPSRYGAQDLDAWRAAGLETLTFEAEAPAIRAAGARSISPSTASSACRAPSTSCRWPA